MQSINAPRLGFGCVSLTTCKSIWHARRILDQAVESGIFYFDTAPSYGRGYSEVILGQFLACNPLTRDRLWIASKLSTCLPSPPKVPAQLAVGINRIRRIVTASRKTKNASACLKNYDPPRLTPFRIQRSDLERSLERSLTSLRTNYLDVCLLHEALPSFLSESAIEYLVQQKMLGVIKHLGIAAHGSNYLNLRENELANWDVLQYEYGRAWPSHGGLISQFPTKHHVVHSCLDEANYMTLSSSVNWSTPSSLLIDAARRLGGGTVLFSSQNLSHIQENANGFNSAILTNGHS